MTPVDSRGLFDDMGEFVRMMKNDGTIRGWFFWILRNLMRARWILDEPENPTEAERSAHELCARYFGIEDNDFGSSGEQGMMRGGMLRLVMHAAQKFLFGFSAMEYAWEVRQVNGGDYWLPTRIEWRAPWSFNRWIYFDDELVGWEQVIQRRPEGLNAGSRENTPRGTDKEKQFIVVPIDNMLIFQHMALDGNPEGESMFRAAWPWYKAKINTVKRDQRGQDRLVDGMTIFKELGTKDGVFEELSEPDIDEAIDLYVEWYSAMIPFLWEPFGLEIKHEWPANEMPPPTERVEYYDKQILMSVGAPMIGALAGDAGARDFEQVTKTLSNSLEQMGQDIAGTLNGVPGVPWTGLIRRICDVNFDTSDDFRYPELRVSSISFKDLGEVVRILSRAEQFLLYTPGAEDERMFRMLMGLQKKSLEEIEKAREAQAQKAGQASQQGTQGGQGGQATPESIRSKGGNEGTGGKPEDSDEEEKSDE